MSFDPFQEQQPQRDPAPRPPLDPENLSDGDRIARDASLRGGSNARNRVIFPAVLLIVTGILNLFFAGGLGFLGVFITPEYLEKAMNDPNQPPAIKEILAKNAEKSTPQEMATQAKVQYIGLGVANVFTMFFAIFAGIRMLQLRNYSLVFFGAFAAAIPCISGSSCCCIGEAAGIYAIIMLLQSDIRDAFR